MALLFPASYNPLYFAQSQMVSYWFLQTSQIYCHPSHSDSNLPFQIPSAIQHNTDSPTPTLQELLSIENHLFSQSPFSLFHFHSHHPYLHTTR